MGVVGLTLRALVLAQHRLGTSSKLHLSLCEATLEAPIAFFDVTPIGKREKQNDDCSNIRVVVRKRLYHNAIDRNTSKSEMTR